MTSDRKIAANRQNAQHSTGPTTPEGLAAIRYNSLKYGLFAETLILPGEDPAEFEAQLNDYRAEYQPATPSDEFLVRQLAVADWRLLRLYRLEAGFHDLQHQTLTDTPYLELAPEDAGPRSVLASFHRSEGRLERSAKNVREVLDHRRP